MNKPAMTGHSSKPVRPQLWRNAASSWNRWITPRSTSRDEAFRERTIRATVAVLLFATVFSFVASIPAYGLSAEALPYPILMAVTAFIFLLSAITVSWGKVMRAGQLLVLALIVASVGIVIIDGYWSPIVAPVLMLVVLITALVLPRSALVTTGVISIGLFGVFAFYQQQTGRIPTPADIDLQVTADAVMVNIMSLVGVEILFLRQLRLEFDDRLSAMRHSMLLTEQARQEADRANRAKSQFLASMTHEFRTPLNAIIGYADIMIEGMAGALTDKQTQINQHVRHNAKRLLHMINNVLDMAKIEAGRVEVMTGPIAPRQIIAETVGSMESLAQAKQITLTTEFDSTLPDTVLCDLTKLQQVLTNLLGNAIKFTSEGGVTVKAGGHDDDRWIISVSDTGIGMPPDAATYIFEAFSQVEDPKHKSVEGTGLGLAICKRHVDLMGGSIAVDTELGKGTTFTILLPRRVKELSVVIGQDADAA